MSYWLVSPTATNMAIKSCLNALNSWDPLIAPEPCDWNPQSPTWESKISILYFQYYKIIPKTCTCMRCLPCMPCLICVGLGDVCGTICHLTTAVANVYGAFNSFIQTIQPGNLQTLDLFARGCAAGTNENIVRLHLMTIGHRPALRSNEATPGSRRSSRGTARPSRGASRPDIRAVVRRRGPPQGAPAKMPECWD